MLGRRVSKSYKTSGDKGFRKAQVLRAEQNSAAEGGIRAFPEWQVKREIMGARPWPVGGLQKRRPHGLRKLFNVRLTKGKEGPGNVYRVLQHITFSHQSCEPCALGSSCATWRWDWVCLTWNDSVFILVWLVSKELFYKVRWLALLFPQTHVPFHSLLNAKTGSHKSRLFWPSDFLLALESNKTDKNTPRHFFFWFQVNIKGILWVTDEVLVQKSRLNIWLQQKDKGTCCMTLGSLSFLSLNFPRMMIISILCVHEGR